MNDDQLNTSQPFSQTQFAGSIPVSQDTADYDKPDQPVVIIKWYKRKKVLAAGFALVAILLGGILAALPRQQEEVTPEEEAEQIIEQPIRGDDPLLDRIRRAQAELTAADPTKTDLVFPLVDLQLELDPVPRR